MDASTAVLLALVLSAISFIAGAWFGGRARDDSPPPEQTSTLLQVARRRADAMRVRWTEAIKREAELATVARDLRKELDMTRMDHRRDYEDMRRFQRLYIQADTELRTLRGDPGASIVITAAPVDAAPEGVRA